MARQQPQSGDDPGLLDIHRLALAALETLRGAYAPPRPVRTGVVSRKAISGERNSDP